MNEQRITMIGIDLAKESFHLHAVDDFGRKVFSKALKRKQVSEFMQNVPACTVAMEACGGSNYWARKFRSMGHEPKLMAAQYVKPFVKSQKNDRNDAEAITEAAVRPSMRFVGVKESWQQDIQTLHRIRERLVRSKVSLSNQVRGILLEYGVTIEEGVTAFRVRLAEVLEDANLELSDSMRMTLRDLYEEFLGIDERKEKYDKQLKALAKAQETCRRLSDVPGVGPITCTAFVSAVGDPRAFENGRQVAAWLGLVPKQYSTGGRQILGRITKRGDCYLRSLLVHGARAVVSSVLRKRGTDPFSVWVLRLADKKGANKASVAVANKNARMMWAMMRNGTDFKLA